MSDRNAEIWYDATHLGSEYEEQYSSSGHWRHRSSRGSLRPLDLEQRLSPDHPGDEGWRYGRAPSGCQHHG